MSSDPRLRPRVVSLLASATEIVCALDLEAHLVGRSHECDHPPSVRRLPVCSQPEIDVERRSAVIDRDVRERAKAGLSVYRVSEAALRELQPDVILTQTQCEVCAVTPRDVEAAVGGWTGRRPRIVSLEPVRLADVWTDVRRVGAALGAEARADALVEALGARMRAVADRARSRPTRPRIACLEWVDPLIGAGSWIPELVAMAGGENVFGAAAEHAPRIEWERLVNADPEVLAIVPCGYDLSLARRDATLLAERPGWPALRAVRAGRVAVVDGNQYVNRSGPRLVESLEVLAEILHPDAFDLGHRGRAWQWL